MTVSPAVRICRLGKFVAPKFAHRYYNAVTLIARLRPAHGIALPASAVDTAFDSSVVAGDWIELPSDPTPPRLEIAGSITYGITLDTGLVDNTLSWLSTYFMIKHGDIIVPGDFPEMPDVIPDSVINITVNGLTCLDFKIK